MANLNGDNRILHGFVAFITDYASLFFYLQKGLCEELKMKSIVLRESEGSHFFEEENEDD